MTSLLLIFKYPFWLVVLLPILVFSISRDKWYPFFFKLARFWAKFVLIGMGLVFRIEREATPNKKKSYIFIANHFSMTDIMLMLVAVKNPFVGKKELAKIPLFVFFYKRTCILVDRSSPRSRQAVFLKAQRRLKQGLSICIFPEGGVPEEHFILDDFKDGAFRLAIHHQIPLVPMTFYDNKKRFSFTFFSGSLGRMRAKIHEFILTNVLTITDTKALNEMARLVTLIALKNRKSSKK